MARDFAGSDYLRRFVAPSAYPVGFAIRFKPDTATPATNERLIHANPGGTAQFMAVIYLPGGNVRYVIRSGGSALPVNTANSASAGVWQTAVAGSASSTDHVVWLNADDANKGTSTTSKAFPSLDRTDVGQQVSAGNEGFNGALAEMAILSKQPTLSEAQAFNSGVSAEIVWSDSAIHRLPIWDDDSPELDEIDGGSWDVTGTTQTDHPPVIFAASPILLPVAAAAAFTRLGQMPVGVMPYALNAFAGKTPAVGGFEPAWAMGHNIGNGFGC